MKFGLSQKARKLTLRQIGAVAGMSAILSTVAMPSLAAECTASMANPTPLPIKAISGVEAAKHVRTLQSELMVAALGCGHRGQYNAFAKTYRTDLQQNGVTLKSHFRAQHGAGGEQALNRYVTALANKASMRMASNSDYCEQTGAVLDYLLNSDTAGLQQVAVHYAQNDSDVTRLAGVTACEQDDAQISSR